MPWPTIRAHALGPCARIGRRPTRDCLLGVPAPGRCGEQAWLSLGLKERRAVERPHNSRCRGNDINSLMLKNGFAAAQHEERRPGYPQGREPPGSYCPGTEKSQPACKPGSVRPARPRGLADVTAIPLGRPLPTASSNQPGWRGRKTGPSPRGLRHPYSVLLPAGLAMPLPLPEARCALTAPFHPYRRQGQDKVLAVPEAVCFLWRCPWGCPRRTLSGAVSPWSPDFPPR